MRLGPYEILDAIGAGGMGEVYRARDTRLDRLVAVKVLPAHLSTNPDRRERFEREARAISSLNHPHICTLHDIGRHEDTDFLVLELVDGESLADRLRRGPLPADQALGRGIEIADALSAAHRRGIVHRDLKPGNVMLTRSGAKLLDFGLAKMRVDSGAPASELPTALARTEAGAVLGTLQYMAPEQLDGIEADARTDIFALGLLLQEMLTGRRAAQSGARLPEQVPTAVAHIIDRCLAHDPDDRWQTASDVKRELEWAAARRDEVPQRPARTKLVPWVMAAALVVAFIAVVWSVSNARRVEEGRPLLLNVNPPAGAEFSLEGGSAISPDGRTLAFVATIGGTDRLWIRPLDSPTARELPGTDGAALPFWSPDGKSMGFFSSGKLKRVDVAGGAPTVLCDVTSGRGGTWNAEGTIVFNAFNDGPLLRVAAAGGAPVALTKVDTANGENSHRFPEFLPDGRRLVYMVRTNDPQTWGVYLTSLDRPAEKKLLVRSRVAASYSPGPDARNGHLLWTRGDELVAQRFDLVAGALVGDAQTVVRGPFAGIVGRSFFAASTEGTLAFEKAPGRTVQLTWYTREGRALSSVGSPNTYAATTGNEMSLSPDGKHLAVSAGQGPDANLWLIDLDRGGAAMRLTRSGGSNPVWSPDGKRIAFLRGAPPNIYVMSASGGDEERLTNGPHSQQLSDWSPDGRFVLYGELPNEVGARAHSELWMVPVTGDRKPVPYLRAAFGETQGRFSRDGKWIAYTSDESGRNEVYVQRFPSDGAKRQVSDRGGSLSRWRKDGRELFYVSPGGVLMSAAVSMSGADIRLSALVALGNFPRSYDVAPDGQRILALAPIEEREASPMTVVVNWPALLKNVQ